MKSFPFLRKFKILMSIVVFSLFFVGCFSERSNKPLIVSSLPVWKNVAEYIGGRDFRYFSILKGGESPHGYEIKPSDVKKLKEASLIIVHGLGLDDWSVKNVSKEKVLNIGELFEKKYPVVKQPGYHIWANPVLMEDIYFEVARRLSEFYPKKETYYTKRAEDYASMIEQLLGRIERCLQGANSKVVVIYHPVWKPLLETFGVKVIEIARTPEEQITPERLRHVIEEAKKENAKVVIGETFASRKVPETIAEAIGGKVLILNPIPDKDYVITLSEWGEKICNALKEQ